MTDDWTDLFGYLAPRVVSTTADEYQACRRTAALMDFSMLRKVDIDGPGAVVLVNSAVTRDITRLPQGRIAYGAMTDEFGKMIDDCTCMIRSPSSVRFCGANDRDLGALGHEPRLTGLAHDRCDQSELLRPRLVQPRHARPRAQSACLSALASTSATEV